MLDREGHGYAGIQIDECDDFLVEEWMQDAFRCGDGASG